MQYYILLLYIYLYTLKSHLYTQMFYLKLQTQSSCICKQKILVQANSKCCVKKYVTYIKHLTCLNLFQLQFKCEIDICVKQYRHIFKQCINETPDLRATIDLLTMYRIATDPERFPERYRYPATARKKRSSRGFPRSQNAMRHARSPFEHTRRCQGVIASGNANNA